MVTINGPSNYSRFPDLTPVYNFDPQSCGNVGLATLGGPSVSVVAYNSYVGPAISSAIIVVGSLIDHGTANVLSNIPIVGHPIMIYSIPQIIQVTYPATTSNGGYFLDNYPVNRTQFRLVRSVQSEIQFYVRDVDRKPVAIGMSESLTINIVDLRTNTTLMTRNLTTIDNANGIYLFTVLPSEMDEWPTTNALSWSITYNRANSTSVLLWTDRAYSPYSTCTVTVGPAPAPATSVTIEGSDLMQLSSSPPMTGIYLYSSALVGAAAFSYQNGMQTFAVTMTNFTGSIRIDASLAQEPTDDADDPTWFQVDLQTYTANTSTVVLNETGNYLWMRLVAITAAIPMGQPSDYWGTVDLILYKN